MEKHYFESLDSISAPALEFVFEDMLLRESSKHPHFDHDNYEWHIGNEVFCTLKSMLRIYAFEFDYKTRKILGIDVFVNTRDVGLRDICLVKKSKEKKTMTIDYTTCHKRNLFIIGTPEIEGIIFHGPCTIVKWSDGDKTIVRCKNEDFDKEKGLAMAICKKMMGTNKTKSNYYDIFKKWLPEEITADNSTHITRSFDILTAEEFANLIGEPLIAVTTACEFGAYKGAKKIMGEWVIPYLKHSEV